MLELNKYLDDYVCNGVKRTNRESPQYVESLRYLSKEPAGMMGHRLFVLSYMGLCADVELCQTIN